MKPALITAACLLIAGFAGCAAIGSYSTVDDGPEWLTDLKALKGTGEATGVSREAREIEARLGAR